jgi:hypothetical protein
MKIVTKKSQYTGNAVFVDGVEFSQISRHFFGSSYFRLPNNISVRVSNHGAAFGGGGYTFSETILNDNCDFEKIGNYWFRLDGEFLTMAYIGKRPTDAVAVKACVSFLKSKAK